MRGFALLLRVIEGVLNAVEQHKQKQREQRIDAIKDNPSGAWGDRFGRVQPTADDYDDTEQLPANRPGDATTER
jgi:hypothetical protein